MLHGGERQAIGNNTAPIGEGEFQAISDISRALAKIVRYKMGGEKDPEGSVR